MMKADRMAGTATALAVLGVGLGYWWADPVAAGLVSLDILHDGATNVANAVTDLMNERPKKTDGSGLEPLPEEPEKRREELDWVERAEVRLREDGHVFFGEAYVVPRGGRAGVDQIARAVDHANAAQLAPARSNGDAGGATAARALLTALGRLVTLRNHYGRLRSALPLASVLRKNGREERRG